MSCSAPSAVTFGVFPQQKVGSLQRSLGAVLTDAEMA
jgi:hypothetical protein